MLSSRLSSPTSSYYYFLTRLSVLISVAIFQNLTVINFSYQLFCFPSKLVPVNKCHIINSTVPPLAKTYYFSPSNPIQIGTLFYLLSTFLIPQFLFHLYILKSMLLIQKHIKYLTLLICSVFSYESIFLSSIFLRNFRLSHA